MSQESTISSTEKAEPNDRWRDFDEPALPRILQAAVDCFVESGYHGTTIRTIAARAELSVPGYYYHYDSKLAILVDIMRRAMDELYARSLGATVSLTGARDAFEAHVECLVLFHAYRGDVAFLASSEIRALPEEARQRHIAARDRQQRLLEDLVERGVAEGVFSAENIRDTVRALITMCTGVAQWYRLDGGYRPEALAQRYVDLALRMVSAH